MNPKVTDLTSLSLADAAALLRRRAVSSLELTQAALARIEAVDPQVKALISSGYANNPVLADWAYYGFSGMVAKPYTMAQLQEALHNVL